MINRINLILKAKNITAKQFAEEIGIQPSGMSHILGGRNNPSLDFAMKVLRRYPEIDANWLILGKGEMYAIGVEHSAPLTQPSLFAEPSVEMKSLVVEEKEEKEEKKEVKGKEEKNQDEMRLINLAEPVALVSSSVEKQVVAEPKDEHRVVKILFIYDDNTYRVLVPVQ